MRFSTILDRGDLGEMTQETAAELSGMSVRSFQRWRERYEVVREAGLVDRRGSPSPRRSPHEEVELSMTPRFSSKVAPENSPVRRVGDQPWA